MEHWLTLMFERGSVSRRHALLCTVECDVLRRLITTRAARVDDARLINKLELLKHRNSN